MQTIELPRRAVARIRRPGRLTVIVLLGLVAIAVSLGVRSSKWARERRLRALTLEETALAIHDTPNDALTFLYYGGKLLNAGHTDASEQAFVRAIDLDPKLPRAHLGLGAARYRNRNVPGAKTAFEEAIRRDPKDPAGYLGLAQCHYQLGSSQPAIDALKKMLALQPRNANAWFYMGKIYGDAHQPDQAYAAIKKAAELNPNRSEYWRHLGQVTRSYSRFAEAEQHLKKAIRLDPNDPVAYYWIGQLYMQMGDTPKLRGYAEAALNHAITRNPNMAEPYYELGRLYERSKNYKLAVLKYRKARSLDLSDDKSLYRLGLSLVALGQKAEGRKLIDGAQKLIAAKEELIMMQKRVAEAPRSPELRSRLGDVYRKYGNLEGAFTEYSLAAKLGMTGEELRTKANACRAELEKQGVEPGRRASAIPVP